MALSRKFRWIEVNRDHTPKIPKEFQVSAYPSLIVIGKEREKIYRFQSFMEPAEFMTQLREGLRRYDLYKSGKDWDPRPPRAESICDGAMVQSFKAPSEEQPGGLAVMGNKLWVAQGNDLYRVDLQTGKTEKSYALGRPARGLCAGEKFLYLVDFGWTAGKPIYVFDPVEGRVVREIITEANKGNKAYSASGITWVEGKLYVLAHSNKLYQVDVESGEIQGERQLPQRSWKLAYDGKHLVTASHVNKKEQVLLLVDPRTLEVVRQVPVNYSLGALEAHEGSYLLMEQPVRGYNTKHQQVRLWPDQMLVYQLRLPAQKR